MNRQFLIGGGAISTFVDAVDNNNTWICGTNYLIEDAPSSPNKILNANSDSYIYTGQVATLFHSVSVWTPTQSNISFAVPPSLYRFTENGAAASVHLALRMLIKLVAGTQYTLTIEYKPIGPNPRGVQLVLGSSGPYYMHAYAGSAGEDLGSYVNGLWTVESYSVSSIGGGVYRATLKGTCPETTSIGTISLYLFSMGVGVVYDGLNNGSGIEFQQTLSPTVLAGSGTYGITGNAQKLYHGYIFIAAKGDYSVLIDGLDVYTKVLLHLDDTTFVDSAKPSRIWTGTGVVANNTNKKFGNSSSYFSGTSSWIDTPVSSVSDLNVGNEDWTVDLWFNIKSAAVAQKWMWATCDSAPTQLTRRIELLISSTNIVQAFVFANNVGISLNGTTTFPANTDVFHHAELSRQGTTLRLFVDGVLEANNTITLPISDVVNKYTVGRLGEYSLAAQYVGFLDEVRFSRGIARHTTNFTPPTIPYSKEVVSFFTGKAFLANQGSYALSGQVHTLKRTKFALSAYIPPVYDHHSNMTLSDNGWPGYTHVGEIPATSLAVATGTQVRITVKFIYFDLGSTCKLYFGQQAPSGDLWDFSIATFPVHITFGGGDIVGDGSTLVYVSDWVTLSEAYDKTKNYLHSAAFTGTLVTIAGEDVPGSRAWYKSGDEAAIINKSSDYTNYPDWHSLVTKIEVRERATYGYTGYNAILRCSHRSLAANGVYSTTGSIASSFRLGKAVIAVRGIYNITGRAATFKARRTAYLLNGNYEILYQNTLARLGHRVLAVNSSYSTAGKIATFFRNYVITVPSGIYTVTGKAGTNVLQALVTNYALSGKAVIERVGYRNLSNNGSFSLSGKNVTSRQIYALAAVKGNYQFTGNSVVLRHNHKIYALYSFYSFSGKTAVLRKQGKLYAFQGNYPLSGKVAAFKATHRLYPTTGSFILVSSPITLRLNHKLYPIVRGNYAVAGKTAVLRLSHKINNVAGIYTTNGKALAFRAKRTIYLVKGNYTRTGIAATFLRKRVLAAAQGSYTTIGKVAVFYRRLCIKTTFAAYNLSGRANILRTKYKIYSAQGSYIQTRNAVSLKFFHRIFANKGSYSAVGKAATLRIGYKFRADKGNYSLLGQANKKLVTYRGLANRNNFVLTGNVATLAKRKRLLALSQNFIILGKPLILRARHFAYANHRVFSLTGRASILRWGYHTGKIGSYSLIGKPVPFLREYALKVKSGIYAQ